MALTVCFIIQAGAFECVVPDIHALEATKRPTLSLLPPVIGRLKKRFSSYGNIVHNYSGKKVVVPFDQIHPAVQDSRSSFLRELDARFDETVGHEEDILTATTLDPRYFGPCFLLFYFILLRILTTVFSFQVQKFSISWCDRGDPEIGTPIPKK